MLDQLILDKQVPMGFTDLFLEEAARHQWLAETLRTHFALWGYVPVMPPTVAYAEGLAVELGSQMAQDMYRFFDRQGRTLALRADLTLPVARIVGTRLYEQPLPLRLFYVGQVFRHISPQRGQRREFTQAGVELVGAGTPQADAEVVALAARALQAVGVQDIQLALGEMGFFRTLMTRIALSEGQVTRLKLAIDRRNDAHLCAVLDDLGLERPMYDLLRALPGLVGGCEGAKWAAVERARQLAPPGPAQAVLDRLQAVLDQLVAFGLEDLILVDLGEVRGMEYYTGLVFQGYAAGVGVALCSGGRYDHLIGHFGPDLPAVGFAMDVGLVRLAAAPPADLRPDAVVQGCAHARCLQAVEQMRARGLRVVVDTLGRSGEELVSYARQRGARAVCCREPGCWQIVDRDGRRRQIDIDKVDDEIAQW